MIYERKRISNEEFADMLIDHFENSSKPATYATLLKSKVQEEYEAFIENLKTKTPDEIIDFSFEKVQKEDLMCIISSHIIEEHFSKVLYNQDNTLDYMYQQWLKYDGSSMDDMFDCIKNTASELYKKHLFDLAWKMAAEADARFMIVEADPPFVSVPEEASDYFTDKELEDYISILEENELCKETPQLDMNMEM